MADLGSGEAEVIQLARERATTQVVLDDLDARRYARRVGLEPVGTLGLLLAARLRGEIHSLRAEIVRLRQVGFYITDALIEAVLKAALDMLWRQLGLRGAHHVNHVTSELVEDLSQERVGTRRQELAAAAAHTKVQR